MLFMDRRIFVVGMFLAVLALAAVVQAQAPRAIMAYLSGIDDAWTIRAGHQ
jgi:hypothetical protein